MILDASTFRILNLNLHFEKGVFPLVLLALANIFQIDACILLINISVVKATAEQSCTLFDSLTLFQ